MGVRGLSSYIRNRKEFFDRIQLSNSKVIIDGNNLRFALYNYCPGLNDCFGGDYDKFYRFVHQYISDLIRFKITPVIVFDGGLDKSDI